MSTHHEALGFGEDTEPPSLPMDKDAEMGVLGAVMLRPDVMDPVAEIVAEKDFFFPAHQLVFQALLELWAQDAEIDPVIVANHLDKHGNLQRVGGAPYLHTLFSSVPTALNAIHYAQIVRDQAQRRSLVHAGQTITQLGYNTSDGMEVEALVDRAEKALFDVTEERPTEDYQPASTLVPATLEKLRTVAEHGEAQGVKTGFSDLDALTNGLHDGQMIIVAARPGVGKSTLALDFVRDAALRQNVPAALFSLEMSSDEIITRLLSAEAQVKLSAMRSGAMNAQDWTSLERAIHTVQDAPIFVDDSPNLSMAHIRSKARRLKKDHDLGIMVVDYIQLMSSGHQVESRQLEVSEFSRQLKLLAKELGIPVIAISQLNRGPESRTDKKPQLSDLRESGSLEQDADIVLLLNRPDSQDRDNERAGEADIIIAKHRGGPIDTIPVAHQLHYSRFVNMARPGRM